MTEPVELIINFHVGKNAAGSQEQNSCKNELDDDFRNTFLEKAK